MYDSNYNKIIYDWGYLLKMETTCESYIISFVDDVNNIELMLSDRQEILSENIKIYTIQQDDCKILNIVNNNNKSLRIELRDKGDLHYYPGRFMFKDYIYIVLYDGKSHRSVYSTYVNLTDMNYKTKLFTIKECIVDTLSDIVFSFLLTPNIMLLIVTIVLFSVFKDNITEMIENMFNIFGWTG